MVPLKYFHAALAGLEEEEASWDGAGIGIELSCSNPDLVSALGSHLEVPACKGDGSETRSLAHHVSNSCSVKPVTGCPVKLSQDVLAVGTTMK